MIEAPERKVRDSNTPRRRRGSSKFTSVSRGDACLGFHSYGGLCFRGQVAHGRILINPDNPPARVAFDHGRARARKIDPIESPRRHVGVYLIGENLNVHGISHVHHETLKDAVHKDGGF